MGDTGLYCVTSWEYRTRHVMFVTFEEETDMFTKELDELLEKQLKILAGRLNR